MTESGHTTITLGDKPFFGCKQCAPSAAPDVLAVMSRDGLDGWDDSPPVRAGGDDIPNGHGSFDVPGYFQGRVLTMRGWVEAASPLQLEFAKSWVRTAVRPDENVPMVVDRSGLVLSLDAVKLSGQLKVVGQVKVGQRWRASFEIPLLAPDPLKYGQRNQFSMASDGAYLDIYHRGDFTAYPKVTITGSAADGYELAHPSGAVYQVDKPLVTGHPHEVDMRTGLLRVDGVVDMVGVTGASVWHVPPGAYHQMKVRPLTVGQTATAVCYVTDTYA